MRTTSLVCLVGLLGVVAACGSSGSSGNASDTSAFLGSWTSNGTQNEVCPNGSHADTGTLTITITDGPSAGQITTSSDGCSLNWNVDGAVATLAGSQPCGTVPGSVGGTWTPTYAGGTLTLSGSTIAANDSGNAVYVNGVTETCSFTQTGNWSK